MVETVGYRFYPQKNTRVWFKTSNKEGLPFQLGVFLRRMMDSDAAVIDVNGETITVPMQFVMPVNENQENGVDDLLHLSDFSEASLTQSLSARYKNDTIYTYCGPILISINPYKSIDIYSTTTIKKYNGSEKHHNPPHLFYVAYNAYESLIKSTPTINQAVIISGESGAGKTEATKILLKYLTQVTKGADGNIENDSLEKKLIDSNPLLESFGNAQTLRNNNSSRFGKFLEIQFCHKGKIAGAKVVNYLLEKTRIVKQAAGERNYHIFYQVLNGANAELKVELGLQPISTYQYLNEGVQKNINQDKQNYNNTIACMKSILNSHDATKNIRSVLTTIAAVLHIGNIEFEDKRAIEGTSIKSGNTALSWVSKLLQITEDRLSQAFCFNMVYVNGEQILKPINIEKAILKRDALGKVLYSLLFRWLVVQLNKIISSGASKIGFIGVLDIYGFESFDTNSFEQFCINFANEKLQRLFNKHIFEVEQDIYESEGIDWSHIEFRDNQKCIDLIDLSSLSLLSLLDEECLMPRGSDQSLLNKLHGNHKDKNSYYSFPRFNNDSQFGVKHYAGTVFYTIDGFLQKNSESLSEDLSSVVQESECEWIRELFSGISGTKSDSRKLRRRSSSLRPSTVSQQFRKQLNLLNEKLDSCNPHYVRCIKPNDEKTENMLIVPRVLEQLKYAGMLEAIRIRQLGYALRAPHEEFFYRYHALDPNAKSCKELVTRLSSAFGLDHHSWQIGLTKVFLRHSLNDLLDTALRIRLKLATRIILKVYKAYRKRVEYEAALRIQSLFSWIAFSKKRLNAIRLQSYLRMLLQHKAFRVHLAGKYSNNSLSCKEINAKQDMQHCNGEDDKLETKDAEEEQSLSVANRKIENDTTSFSSTLRPGVEVNSEIEKLRAENSALRSKLMHAERKNVIFTERESITCIRLYNLRKCLLQTNVKSAKTKFPDGYGEDMEEEFRILEDVSEEIITKMKSLNEESETRFSAEQASSLMKENIALMDQVVDMRTNFENVRIRLQNTLIRAKQAEYANDTLCTILAWRDKQLNAIKQSHIGDSAVSEKDYENSLLKEECKQIESAIKTLTPYFDRISSSHVDVSNRD